MPTPPRPSSILAVIRAGVQALRRRLYVVIYPLRPARPWRFPVATRPMQADSASDPGVLLEGYLVSELEAAERELFESWLALDDTRELTVAALRHPYDRDNGTPADSDPNVGDWWEECRQRIHTPRTTRQTRARSSRSSGRPLLHRSAGMCRPRGQASPHRSSARRWASGRCTRNTRTRPLLRTPLNAHTPPPAASAPSSRWMARW